MTKATTIDGRAIGAEKSLYVIAEMSANHNGSADTALKIIEQPRYRRRRC